MRNANPLHVPTKYFLQHAMVSTCDFYLMLANSFAPHFVEAKPCLFRHSATLSQPFPFDIDPQPSPVVGLIAEALCLCCKVLGLVGWNTTLVDVDGNPFLERFNIRDKGWVRYRGWAHDVPSQSGRRIPSTISRFCASLMPPE